MAHRLKSTFLKAISKRSTKLAFGYVRECEKNNEPNLSVPEAIKYLCLLFLNQTDKFNKKLSSKSITINENERSVATSRLSLILQNVYLQNIINSKENLTHIWRFRLNKLRDASSLIGIQRVSTAVPYTSGEYFDMAHFGYSGDRLGYGYATHGILTGSDGRSWGNWYGVKCKQGDIFSMEVNCKEMTVSFEINDQKFGIAFNIAQGEYRAAISMKPDTKFTLISYCSK